MRSKIFRVHLLLFAGLALAVISACHNAQLAEYRAYASDADVPRISVQEAKMDYDSGTAIIIDSRDANSYGQEHIAGSINIPSGSADADYTNIPKDKKIIVYCS